MAKVYPQVDANSTSSKQEVFTLWMKSLIFSSNGCAVFDSDGRIVYRVDNYGHKSINQVHLMDAAGRVLFTIVRKKFSLFAMWDGYRSTTADANNKKRRFRVKKLMGIRMILGFLRGYSVYRALIRMDENTSYEYTMENQNSKLCCRIVDNLGGLVAEIKRKMTNGGISLGQDVLTMVVEPHVDHCLVTGLVVVLGLIHHKL